MKNYLKFIFCKNYIMIARNQYSQTQDGPFRHDSFLNSPLYRVQQQSVSNIFAWAGWAINKEKCFVLLILYVLFQIYYISCDLKTRNESRNWRQQIAHFITRQQFSGNLSTKHSTDAILFVWRHISWYVQQITYLFKSFPCCIFLLLLVWIMYCIALYLPN